MGFSQLFILQLRSWPRGLGFLDSDSGPDVSDLLILDLLLLNFCIPWPFMLEPTLQTAQALRGDVTSWILWVVQDLAVSATARHPTHLLPLKLMLHWESGFSKPITSPRFKVAPWGRTMQGYSRSSIIAAYLIAFIGGTRLTRFSTT